MHKGFTIRTSQVPRSLRMFFLSFFFLSFFLSFFFHPFFHPLFRFAAQHASGIRTPKIQIQTPGKKNPPPYQVGIHPREKKRREDETHDDDDDPKVPSTRPCPWRSKEAPPPTPKPSMSIQTPPFSRDKRSQGKGVRKGDMCFLFISKGG